MPITIIVEDGSIVANANSYISVADASSYHSIRGNVAWANATSDDIRGTALINACDYLETVYYTKWIGSKTSTTQNLAWPRNRFNSYFLNFGFSVPYGGPIGVGIGDGIGQGGNGGGIPLWGLYDCDYEYLSGTSVPKGISLAQAELALIALSGPLQPNQNQPKKSVKIGSLAIEYNTNFPQQTQFIAASRRLTPFLSGYANPVMRRLVRG